MSPDGRSSMTREERRARLTGLGLRAAKLIEHTNFRIQDIADELQMPVRKLYRSLHIAFPDGDWPRRRA